MTSPSLGAEALARVLLGSAIGVKRGENVLIETWTHTIPYAAACVIETRRRGAFPLLLYEDEVAYWRSMDEAPRSHLGRVGSHEWAALAKTNAYVFFPGPADRPRLDRFSSRERGQVLGYNAEWYRRAARAKLRGARSLLGYASDAQAARWHVDGMTWREQLVRASVEVDLATLRRESIRVSAKLKGGRELRLTAANGTDLALKLKGRSPLADDGVIDAADVKAGNNMTAHPPGAVAVAVDERSARGIVVANRPSFLRSGRAEGGQWEFEAGRLTSFSFTDGQASFEERVDELAPGWDRAGIFSIGLNPSLGPGTPMVEDQEAGATTIAIGGNKFYGGTNASPFLAWLAVGEATVAVDGKPVVDRGKIL